ncbi:2,3-bisphosphoglycerate-independent phosphoglycerate mutase 1 [Termitomyces sp. T112]|nr:2,3-bisphosphoglycerate-independent phosphoglycerate mutase 1 [Termitomyces sp. T112]
MAAQYRAQRAAQIHADGEIARRLQDREEELLVAASIRSANERQLPSSQTPFVPPVVLSEEYSDEEEQEDNPPVIPSSPVRDRNGAYTPESYHDRFPPHRPASAIPPVVPPPPELDQNGAYTPPPHPSRFSRGFTSVIPPVVPPTSSVRDESRSRAPGSCGPSQPPRSTPVIPPAPPTTFVRGRNAPGPFQPPQPRQPVAVIPPVVPDPYPPVHNTSFRRAATPVPPRPTYEHWYPPGVVPHHMRPQTLRPVYYYPPQQPPRILVPAPLIPPIFQSPKPSVVNPPPPKQTEEPIVPFIPPMPDEKPEPKTAPRPILKNKPASAVRPSKATVSLENGDIRTSVKPLTKDNMNVPRKQVAPAQSPREAEEMTESSESSESNTLVEEDEITDNDVEPESGPLQDLRKHANLLTGSFKCSCCSTMMQTKPIHKHLGTLSPYLPSLDSHLHLMCSECYTLYCRGCHHISRCKRTCNAGPDEDCLLKTCCRAGRAIAIFAILSCFDAKFLAMVSASPYSTYIEYIKNALSSSSASSLSALLCTTINSLLPWLPVDPIHSKSPPHVHRSVEPLFRVSLLLEVIRIYLHAPLDRWIRPRNGQVYELILMFLRRLEEVGKGAIAGLVLKPGRGIRRTKGVGEVVWALAECAGEKNKGNRMRKNLGWTAGNEHESFSETLGKKKLRQDLQDLKDKIQQDQKEKKKLLDQFLCQLLSWSMADVLKN